MPSASSRLKLYVACVRSLVPKLKNSAPEPTRSPAVRAPLTTSTMVPKATRMPRPPGSVRLRAAILSNIFLTKSSSDALPTCGTIIWGRAVMPCRLSDMAASNTASICVS